MDNLGPDTFGKQDVTSSTQDMVYGMFSSENLTQSTPSPAVSPAKIKVIDASLMDFDVIDSSTPVYEESDQIKAKKEEMERAKDYEAGYRPISFEDYFDDFK